jgi:hypothetical protein
VASHAAAGALLFAQLISLGQTPQVESDVITAAAVSLLKSEIAQMQVRFPLTYGVLDGVIMLLTQMLEHIVCICSLLIFVFNLMRLMTMNEKKKLNVFHSFIYLFIYFF